MAAREEGHEEALQQMILADDEPAELEEDLLHRLLAVAARGPVR